MDEMLHCCRLTDKSENQNLTTELLSALELSFSSWFDKEGNDSYHTVYADDEESAQSVSYLIESQLKDWEDLGIKISDISVVSIKKEDWTEVWKSFFKIQKLSDRLIVKPSWLEFTPENDQIVIEIDPGMSFGTGRHATTRFCLKMLDKLANYQKHKSFLDAGCGSGILSIAAIKLNYKPVTAFDIDPDAIAVAKENFEKNNIPLSAVKLSVSDLAEFANSQAKYDVIAANILSPVLKRNKEILMNLINPDGCLLLAGILQPEYVTIRDTFCNLGFHEELTVKEDEWQSGLFSLKNT